MLLEKSGAICAAFEASSLLIVGAVASIAIALYPNLLPAWPDRLQPDHLQRLGLPYGLKVALVWFAIGLVLIGIYMLVTHRPFTGRVRSEGEEY